MRSPDLGLSDEDSQREDDNAVLGCEAQPDDVPNGLYNWSQEDIVPCLETLCISIEFIKGLEGASLDRDPICYVSTGHQPDLGGALSDCHLLSCVGVSPKVFSQCLIRDGTLQHVSSKTATLQPVRSCKQNTQ